MIKINKNAPLSRQSLKFISDIFKTVGENTYANYIETELPKVMSFSLENKVVDMLCPYHNDHSFSKTNNNSSFKVEDNYIHCWIDNKNINLSTFLSTTPLLRSPKQTVHAEDTTSMAIIDEWVNIYQSVINEYGNFNNLIAKATELQPSLLKTYKDFIYNSQPIHNEQEIKYLQLLSAISQFAPNETLQQAYDYIKSRGFNQIDFIKSLQPFLYGENAINDLLSAIASYEASYNTQIFATENEKIEFLTALRFLIVNNNVPSSILQNRLALPIYNENNELINFNLRATLPEQVPKYLYLAKDTQNAMINDVLRLLSVNNMSHIGWLEPNVKNKQIFLVEGAWDQKSLAYNAYASGCLFTKTATKEQLAKLQNLVNDNNELIIAFDNDAAGILGALALSNVATAYGFETKIIVPPLFYDNQPVNDWNDLQKLWNTKYDKMIEKSGLGWYKTGEQLWTYKKDMLHTAYKSAIIKTPANLYESLNNYLYQSFYDNFGLDYFQIQTIVLITKFFKTKHNDIADNNYLFKDLLQYPQNASNTYFNQLKIYLTNSQNLNYDLQWLTNDLLPYIEKYFSASEFSELKTILNPTNIQYNALQMVQKDLKSLIYQASKTRDLNLAKSYNKNVLDNIKNYYDKNTGNYTNEANLSPYENNLYSSKVSRTYAKKVKEQEIIVNENLVKEQPQNNENMVWQTIQKKI